MQSKVETCAVDKIVLRRFRTASLAPSSPVTVGGPSRFLDASFFRLGTFSIVNPLRLYRLMLHLMHLDLVLTDNTNRLPTYNRWQTYLSHPDLVKGPSRGSQSVFAKGAPERNGQLFDIDNYLVLPID